MDSDVIFLYSLRLTIILALGLYITNIVFSFKYVPYELDKADVIININQILNSKLIYDFNPRKKCLNGEEKLVLGKWDGTINKCNCRGFIKQFDCIKQDKDCQTIQGEKPKNYTIFDGK